MHQDAISQFINSDNKPVRFQANTIDKICNIHHNYESYEKNFEKYEIKNQFKNNAK